MSLTFMLISSNTNVIGRRRQPGGPEQGRVRTGKPALSNGFVSI
jgi:hypothetical protein